MAKKNTYDVTRDLPLAPALVFHLDAATGAQVGSAGEGVKSFGIVLRSMHGEDGTPGPARIAVHDVFVAKASSGNRQRLQRWICGQGNKLVLGVPSEGHVCLGSSIGRLDLHLAAAVYEKAAAYSKAVAAKLAARTKAA